MPMCSDVKNCLSGDVTLRCDILLGGLFASVFLLVFLSCSALLLCYDCALCSCIICIRETNVPLEEKNNSSFNVGFLIFLQVMIISLHFSCFLFILKLVQSVLVLCCSTVSY